MKVHHSKVHDESISGEPVNCDWCGDTFRTNKYRIENQETHFCDRDCQTSWQADNWSGDSSPRSTLEEVDCKVCDDAILRPKWQREQNDDFLCSEECRGLMMSDLHYKGGYKRDEGKGWRRLKRRTREKYNHTCQACGEKCRDDKHHAVHHIKPIREFDEATKANFESNVTLLCRHCHKPIETKMERDKQFELLQRDGQPDSWERVQEVMDDV